MNGQTASTLSDLLYADRVLMQIYDDVLDRVGAETASALRDAASDHRRHGAALEQACALVDMELAEAGDDVIELMEEHLRLVRSGRDEASLLEALVLAERANAVLYGFAEREELPEELGDLVAEQHADERMHVGILTDRVPHARRIADEHNVACFTGGMTDDINPDDFD